MCACSADKQSLYVKNIQCLFLSIIKLLFDIKINSSKFFFVNSKKKESKCSYRDQIVRIHHRSFDFVIIQ